MNDKIIARIRSRRVAAIAADPHGHEHQTSDLYLREALELAAQSPDARDPGRVDRLLRWLDAPAHSASSQPAMSMLESTWARSKLAQEYAEDGDYASGARILHAAARCLDERARALVSDFTGKMYVIEAADAMTPAEAFAIASKWGSYTSDGDPGACMYAFHANDGRPLSEAHRRDCIGWLYTRRPAYKDAQELATLITFLRYAPLYDA